MARRQRVLPDRTGPPRRQPRQRIADDLDSLASTTLGLSLDLLSTIVTLCSFVVILWNIGGALTFNAFGMHISIPGYMVWAAALYALLGSFVIQRFGKPLVAINYQKQRVEANFRFFLIRVRENAEQIALYKGAEVERTHSRTAFQAIYDNWRAIMTYTKRPDHRQRGLPTRSRSSSRPWSHRRAISRGAYPIGTLFQIGDAFGTVSDSFSWFINSFTTLANWRATGSTGCASSSVRSTSNIRARPCRRRTEHVGSTGTWSMPMRCRPTS